jgi:hypothetical protein
VLGRESRGASVPLTLGAVANRLRELGYEPVSAIFPQGRIVNTMPAARFEAHPLHLVSEHPPAVLVGPPLAVLVLTPPEDKALEVRIRTALEKRGLIRGPVRVGSDGREARLIRLQGQGLAGREMLEGAVRIDHQTNDRVQLVPTFLPLDGRWPEGDLLSVPMAKLPEIDAGAMAKLFEELSMAPYQIASEREPVKPSRRAWLGGAS